MISDLTQFIQNAGCAGFSLSRSQILLLFHVKSVVRDSGKIELACLKKVILSSHFVTFRVGTYFHDALLGVLLQI